MAQDAHHASAAYGRFYLENRPVLLREAELPDPPDARAVAMAREWGFHRVHAASDMEAPSYDGPFAASHRAAWGVAHASDDHPAMVHGLPPDPAAIVSAVARGAGGFGLRLDTAIMQHGLSHDVLSLHQWLEHHEDELTSSVEVRDALALLEYPAYGFWPDLEGGFGVLVCAGYNPTLVDLAVASDADLAEFPAAIFPSRGYLDLDTYGKLVVLTLRGATLVTYPEPVRRQVDGTPFRTTFLWPPTARPASRGRGTEAEVGRRFQVRDGVSTILHQPLGEPHCGPAYWRLPAGQRRAHRQLVLSLVEEVAPRTLAPAEDLELEAVARLSPDGGALLFVVNRLDAQVGTIAIPAPEALNVGRPLLLESLFSTADSQAEPAGDGIRVRMGPKGVLILRLG
ncbi:MAG TPA: hypothetical protein VFX49_14370 [Chloroflexota bacterium]|nr:hypothetical protein [Chloroflexota bacterium]